MGKPKSVFNKKVEVDRALAKQQGQIRQNATGMSSTFQSMPLNPPLISGGDNYRVGTDTIKTNVGYFTSLRLDNETRIDFSTAGIVYDTDNIASELHSFDIGGTTVMQINSSQIDCRQDLVCSTGLKDIGSTGSPFADCVVSELSLQAKTAPSSPSNGELWLNSSDNKVYVRSGGATSEVGGSSAEVTTWTANHDANGNLLILDPDGDTSISSASDDNILFLTGSATRMALSNSGLLMSSDANFNSNDITGLKTVIFNNSGIPASGQVGIGSTTGDMYFEVPSPDSYFFRIDNSTIVEMNEDGIDIRQGWLELTEITTPSGISNHVRLYAEDNGSGKTRLMARINASDIVLATEA